MNVSNAIYNGLSDSLSAAIDTGNDDEVALVLLRADHACDAEQLTTEQADALMAQAREAGYDF